jgi:hypothetical protein
MPELLVILQSSYFPFTDNGKVIKAVNAGSADTTERVTPVVIEEIQVFPPQVAVRNLKVVRDSSLPDGRLVVVSDGEVQALRLHRCYSDKILSCRYVITSFSNVVKRMDTLIQVALYLKSLATFPVKLYVVFEQCVLLLNTRFIFERYPF